MAWQVFERPSKVGRPPRPPVHGLKSTYSRGCRCVGCTRANTEFYRARRARLSAAAK